MCTDSCPSARWACTALVDAREFGDEASAKGVYMPKSTRSRYTQEFKAEAVKRACSSPERSIRQLAYELGISDQTIRNWINQARIDRGEREGLTPEEREELRRLRRENRILRGERAIPKKAAAFFAMEDGTRWPAIGSSRRRRPLTLSPCCAGSSDRSLLFLFLRLEEKATLREGPLRRGALSEDRDDKL